ncbi:hypothetical protein BH24ACT13_BH24ACT13_11020 [soil metagenome]
MARAGEAEGRAETSRPATPPRARDGRLHLPFNTCRRPIGYAAFHSEYLLDYSEYRL